MDSFEYSGIDNLETMSHAKNYNKFLVDTVIRNIPPAADAIVDFGAGTGFFAAAVSGFGYKVACVEPDIMLGSMLTKTGFNVFTSLDDIPESSLDYIYSLNVLEHVYDDFTCVATLLDRLRYGGKILIFVPAFSMLFTNMDKKVGHFRRYNKKSIYDLFEENSVRIEQLTYVDSIGFFATFLYKIIDRSDGKINTSMLKVYDKYFFSLSLVLDRALRFFFGKNLLLVATKIKRESA